MIKKNIKFITTGQFVTFYNICKGFSSDVRVRDLENQHLDINAKKLSELATIPLGLPYVLIIHGDDEKKLTSYFKNTGLYHEVSLISSICSWLQNQ